MNAHRDYLRGIVDAARRQADALDALAVGMGAEPEAEHEARRLRANAGRLDAAIEGRRDEGDRGRDLTLVLLGAILGAAAVALLPPLLQMAGWLS